MASLSKREVVKQGLMSDIVGGRYETGQRLAGEAPLAANYGVSVGTMRQALAELAHDGVLRRVHGSGTYVDFRTDRTIAVNVPVVSPRKVLFQHFWERLNTFSSNSDFDVRLGQVQHRPAATNWQLQRKVAQLFATEQQPVGLFEVTMKELPWLIEAGWCEDLTSRIPSWPQSDNIVPVALQGVSQNERVYGLPFHGSLTGLTYNQSLFKAEGLDPQQTVRSPENLLASAQRFSKRGGLQNTLWVANVRILLMHLLHAYYDDPPKRFAGHDAAPLEKDVAETLCMMLHRLKFRFGARVPCYGDPLTDADWPAYYRGMASGRIAMGLVQLTPPPLYVHYDPRGTAVRFEPLAFGTGGTPFSYFNCYVWIINPRLGAEQREFLWSFLADYVQPSSEFELDQRYSSEGSINGRDNVFIDDLPRVPPDPHYADTRRELFRYARPEIAYPAPAFDLFALAVSRALFCEQVDFAREYEFYLAMLDHFGVSGIEDVFETATSRNGPGPVAL